MRTVIVSFYTVFPPVCGAATVTYNIINYLLGEKYLIQLSDPNTYKEIDKGINLINIPCISNIRFIKAISLLVQFPNIIKKIKQLAPERVILEGASWSLYYLILFYLMKINKINSRIIYHAHNVEYLLRKQKNNYIIAIVTKLAESIIVKKVDAIYVVSKIDAFNCEKIYGIKPQILPNGVDVERFDAVADDQIHKIKSKYSLTGKIVLFMGLPTFKPNREAIDFLVNKVFPFVIKDCPDAKLAIIGGRIKYNKVWIINPGSIPFKEVPVFIKSCDICVAPIFSGSGTKLKILEYMAAGKPVVATTKGTEGIAIKDGENIIIADNANKFMEKILFLLKDSKIAKEVGYEGLIAVKANYSWQAIMQNFNKTLYGYEHECA